MKRIYLFPMLLSLCVISCDRGAKENPSDTALERLMKGNERFVQNQPIYQNRSEEFRKKRMQKTYPFAIIVASSSSRASPEIIFDQGLGELFVIRTAGNVICPSQMDSVRYALTHFSPDLVLVVGEQDSGVVNAVLEGNTEAIPAIAKKIQPAVSMVRKQDLKDPLEAAIKQNAINVKKTIENDPVIRRMISKNEVSVKAAYHSLDKGSVHLIQEKNAPHLKEAP